MRRSIILSLYLHLGFLVNLIKPFGVHCVCHYANMGVILPAIASKFLLLFCCFHLNICKLRMGSCHSESSASFSRKPFVRQTFCWRVIKVVNQPTVVSVIAGNAKGESITVLLTSCFDWFGISCMTTDNFCFICKTD